MDNYFDNNPNTSFLEDFENKEPEIAGRGLRLLAYLIDAVIFLVIIGILGAALAVIDPENPIFTADDSSLSYKLLDRLISTVIYVFFSAFLEGSSLQASLGKRILNLKVCDTEYRTINFKTALKRNAAKMIPFAVIAILFNDKNQGFHDQLADTLVVKRN